MTVQGLNGMPSAPAADPFSSRLFHVADERVSGTAGGAATSGSWLIRTLQTVKTNDIPGASLASNIITLPAGKYWCQFTAHFFQNTNNSQHRLYNTSLGEMIALSINAHADATSTSASGGAAQFTLQNPTKIELQYRVELTRGTDGLGEEMSWGVEVYANVYIWKIG